MKDGQNILQRAIPLNTSRTDKDCTVLLQRYGSLCLYGTTFFLDAATNQKERETFLYGAPFVKILYLTDLAQKLLSLPEIAISACRDVISGRDSYLCMQRYYLWQR